ncbi:MAG: amino acid kinase family protein [Pirellulaceae bacterium]
MTVPQPNVMFPCRVIKVGGSLLSLPGLGRVLTDWLDRQSILDTLLIVGGGELVDAIRQMDQEYGLDKEVAHWLAVRAMNLNGFVVSQLVPGGTWTASLGHWRGDQEPNRPRRRFLSPDYFLRWEEPMLPGVRLPLGWHVTSDSIAARVAEVCQAQELVLLKSTVPTTARLPISGAEAVTTGFVDRQFLASAAPVKRIRAVNLRDAAFEETSLIV